MIPIDIQVNRSRSKVKPIIHMLGKGALVFTKHLYFINCCINCEAHNKLPVSFCFESVFLCYQERIETRHR